MRASSNMKRFGKLQPIPGMDSLKKPPAAPTLGAVKQSSHISAVDLPLPKQGQHSNLSLPPLLRRDPSKKMAGLAAQQPVLIDGHAQARADFERIAEQVQ